MKIQKGIVKYKDREDIICTYGVTEDNRQYYFLDASDEKKFSNGNRIASKDLKEAIDPMVKASQVGVIDENGNEVIPFVNRAIRPVNNDIVLIEVANPVSQGVIDAINLKSDPNAATQLVSTTSTIKDNLNQKMNGNGRFLFNDIFSEATVADINGNNLVNGEYYSFIGLANDKLYFSKNTADSQITEYSILPPEVQSDITPSSDTNDINVNNVEVPSDVVENALNGTPDINQENQPSQEVAPVVGEDNTVVDNSVVTPSVDVQSDIVPPVVEESVAAPLEDDNVAEVTQDNVQTETSMVATEAVNTDVSNSFAIPTVGNAGANQEVTNNIVTTEEVSAPVNETSALNSEVGVSDNEVNVPAEESVNSTEVPPVINSSVVESTVAPSEVESSVGADTPAEENVEVNTEVSADTNSVVSEEAVADNVSEKEVNDTIVSEEVPTSVSEEFPEVKEEVVLPVVKEVQDVTTVSPEEVADAVAVEEEKEDAEKEPVDIFKDEVEEEVKRPAKTKRMPFSSVLSDKPVDVEEEIDEVDSVVSASKKEKTALDKLFQDTSDDSIKDEFEQDMGDELYNDSNVELDDIDVSEKMNDRVEYTDVFEDHDYKDVQPMSGKDTIMADIAKSMTNLMKQNRELKASLVESRNRYEKISASRRNIADRAKMLEQKNDILGTKLHNEETMKNKAMAKISTLEAKVREQDRIIAAQTRELNSLRPQLAGKEDLVKILADASLLLDEDSNYNYDDGESYYRRSA